ncbi:ribonuclease Z [Sulfolobus tengchongensis]|uniref:Ribonuclease Z n=1 Tax=Sulfolobus tengchongensis TaxID=207809 RepID=A0AAX4L0N7_9CREN
MIQVFFLGTSGGSPSKKRRLPAFLIRREALNILLDCGEGTQYTLMSYKLGINSIKVIGISHMHGDHVFGLLGLIASMGLLDRKDTLYLLGPRKLKDFLFTAFEYSKFYPPFKIEFIDAYSDSDITITTFKTCHTIESQGYLIIEKDRVKINEEKIRDEGIKDWRIIRKLKEGNPVEFNGKVLKPDDYLIVKKGLKIAYTGDTRPCQSVIDSVKNVDLLIHEATFLNEPSAYTYGHSNVGDAATVALEASVKLLALTHISPRYDDVSLHLREARRIFLKSILPDDLSYITLK